MAFRLKSHRIVRSPAFHAKASQEMDANGPRAWGHGAEEIGESSVSPQIGDPIVNSCCKALKKNTNHILVKMHGVTVRLLQKRIPLASVACYYSNLPEPFRDGLDQQSKIQQNTHHQNNHWKAAPAVFAGPPNIMIEGLRTPSTTAARSAL